MNTPTDTTSSSIDVLNSNVMPFYVLLCRRRPFRRPVISFLGPPPGPVALCALYVYELPSDHKRGMADFVAVVLCTLNAYNNNITLVSLSGLIRCTNNGAKYAT